MTPNGSLVADHCGAQNLQTGILAALFARERTGRGQRVDVSLLGGQIWLQASGYTHRLMSGEPAGRSNGGHPPAHALYGIFRERLAATGQRFAKVRGHDEVVADPQSFANGYLVEVDHPTWGRMPVTGNPITMSDTPTRPGIVAPEPGQDTELVLVEAGFSWEELADLQAKGAW